MYRLPTQFDASASRQDLAAAGGGSTSTTCSSCVVTLLGTSVLSAVVLGKLEPVAPAAISSAADIPPSPSIPPPSATASHLRCRRNRPVPSLPITRRHRHR